MNHMRTASPVTSGDYTDHHGEAGISINPASNGGDAQSPKDVFNVCCVPVRLLEMCIGPNEDACIIPDRRNRGNPVVQTFMEQCLAFHYRTNLYPAVCTVRMCTGCDGSVSIAFLKDRI